MFGTLSQQNEMQEMKLNSSTNAPHRWPAENYGTDAMSDGYQRAQNLHEAPLTGKLLQNFYLNTQLNQIRHLKIMLKSFNDSY